MRTTAASTNSRCSTRARRRTIPVVAHHSPSSPAKTAPSLAIRSAASSSPRARRIAAASSAACRRSDKTCFVRAIDFCTWWMHELYGQNGAAALR